MPVRPVRPQYNLEEEHKSWLEKQTIYENTEKTITPLKTNGWNGLRSDRLG